MQNSQQQAEQAASVLGCDPSELLDPFTLDMITSSKAKTFPPQRIVIYGTPGIGKTTFAGTFPNPILVRLEDGAAALDIPTFPKVVIALSELDQALRALNKQHNFKTLIIDSLDWLEPLVWRYVCRQAGVENIEDFGYGKGYVKVDDVWRNIQSKIQKLCDNHKMNVVTIAHAVPVTVDPPDMDPYQRYSLKLHKRASAIWMEWADMILFVNYKTHLISTDTGSSDSRKKRKKAEGTGERVIYTQERPAYQAKCRWPLDEMIVVGNDPTWAAFHENLTEATGGAYLYG